MDKDERCAICLADYEEENEVMMGDCFHAFHRECLEVSSLYFVQGVVDADDLLS